LESAGQFWAVPTSRSQVSSHCDLSNPNPCAVLLNHESFQTFLFIIEWFESFPQLRIKRKFFRLREPKLHWKWNSSAPSYGQPRINAKESQLATGNPCSSLEPHSQHRNSILRPRRVEHSFGRCGRVDRLKKRLWCTLRDPTPVINAKIAFLVGSAQFN